MRPCKTCGTEIPALEHGNTRYCSSACRPSHTTAAKTTPFTGRCLACKGELAPRPNENQHEFHRRRYCNLKCAAVKNCAAARREKALKKWSPSSASTSTPTPLDGTKIPS